ncbi:hypothetical protein [Ornithinibacillus contaminans]|nr:hypothetical protein [Ornithinibacillus contaminans]
MNGRNIARKGEISLERQEHRPNCPNIAQTAETSPETPKYRPN